MTPRRDGEAVRVTVACGCVYQRRKQWVQIDQFWQTHMRWGDECVHVVGLNRGVMHVHGGDIDWTRVAAGYCMALSERTRS